MKNSYSQLAEQLAKLVQIKAMQLEITGGCSRATVMSTGSISGGSVVEFRSEDTKYVYRMTVSASRTNSVIGIIEIGDRPYRVHLFPNDDGRTSWSFVEGWVP